MYTEKEIDYVKNLIVKFENPKKIILFGSYAYGKPNKQSDLDLLVIKEDEDRQNYIPDEEYDVDKDYDLKAEAKLNSRIFKETIKDKINVIGDVFLMTERQAAYLAKHTNGSMVDALGKGKVIYENTNKER